MNQEVGIPKSPQITEWTLRLAQLADRVLQGQIALSARLEPVLRTECVAEAAACETKAVELVPTANNLREICCTLELAIARNESTIRLLEI